MPRLDGFRGPLLVAAIAAFAFFGFIGQEADWASHEDRHAEIAREFDATGDWTIPHLNGEVYVDKPPLMHWLAALLYRVEGEPTMRAARLPSAAAGIACALAVYGIGALLASHRAGFLAALFLAATPPFHRMARIVRPDIFLVAGAVVACFAAAWVTLRGRERRGASYGMSALFGAATGLAVLSKGPLGLAIPVVFAALVGARERRFPFRDAAGAAVALLALAATIGAWLLPVLHHPGGAAYLHDMLHQKDLETGVAQHARPFYFYLGPFAGGFAPFLIFLGLGAHDEVRPRFRPTPALVMAALLFLLFSAIPGKRWHYLLPIYPFAALVAAAAVDRRFERHRLWRAVPLGIAAVLIAGSVAYYALLPIGRTLPFGKKIFDDNRARDFATAVEGCVPKDREVGSVRTFAEAIAFVGRRHVRELWTPEAAARWLAEDPSRCVAISRAERPALERAFGAPLVTLFEEEPTGAGGKADRMDALHCVVRPAAN